MAKLAHLASTATLIGTIVGALTFASLTTSSVDAADACQHKDFKTEMGKNACAAGGQKAAKDAMKKFMKDAKIKSCNQCHAKLAPTYDLKPDAYDQFKKAGGKMLDASSSTSATKAPAATAKPSPKAK